MDHFFRDLGLKRRHLTEAITYATLSSSKQMLSLFYLLIKNLFALATMKNSHNNQQCSFVATKKKHVGAKRYLRSRMSE